MQSQNRKLELLRNLIKSGHNALAFKDKFGEVALERVNYFVEHLAVTSLRAQESAYSELVQFVARNLRTLRRNDSLEEVIADVRGELSHSVAKLQTTSVVPEVHEAFDALMNSLNRLVCEAVRDVPVPYPVPDPLPPSSFSANVWEPISDVEDELDPETRVEALLRENRELRLRIDALEKARRNYASEFPLTEDGEPDVGNIHANIRRLKYELLGYQKS